MLSAQTRRYLDWAGHVLSVVAVAFVLWKVLAYRDQLDAQLWSRLLWPIIALSAVYAAACALTAMAWRDALAHAGLTLGRRTALHIYGVSQVAKYIPGNFLHLLGRQAMGVASGVPAVPLARSMAWELLLLAIAGALFLVPVLPSWLNVLSPGGALTAWIVTTVLAYVLVSRLMSRELGAALLWNTGFLAVSGLVFAALLYRVSPTAVTGSESLLLVVAGYAVAWLAGFVTPGAPAGVGIREWVAWALLQHVAAESEVLAAVIAARMVSVLGDLLFFMFAQLSGPGRPVASR